MANYGRIQSEMQPALLQRGKFFERCCQWLKNTHYLGVYDIVVRNRRLTERRSAERRQQDRRRCRQVSRHLVYPALGGGYIGLLAERRQHQRRCDGDRRRTERRRSDE